MKNVVTEFVGTFFLVLTIGLTVLGETPFAPLAIGAMLMVMVYMGGHVSGGHYNPAVSLAMVMRRKLPLGQFLPYVVAQLAGAVGAAAMTSAIMGKTLNVAPAPGPSMIPALLVEILFTFALALVVLNAATHLGVKGNSFYGLAIGFTVASAAFAGGHISGGAFNPAVGLGPSLFGVMAGTGTLRYAWLYILGPCAGAALAALVFSIQEK